MPHSPAETDRVAAPTRPAAVAILRQRLVAIIRSTSARNAVETGTALLTAGVHAVEVSLTTPGALHAVAELRENLPPSAELGVGTVLSAADARAAASVGASFIVAPNLEPAVIEQGHRDGLAVIPGVATPSEMVRARAAGADLIKLFPASVWTPAAVLDVRAALPDLLLVPTGGITAALAPEWIQNGCAAVGMGSALSAGTPEDVARRAQALLAALAPSQ